MCNKCLKCLKDLSNDEIAIFRKLIHRNAKKYLCVECLAKKLECNKELIAEKIEYFREQGCYLFPD